MSERKLASIRKISAITPIPDADAIECAQVDGWKVVVKKDEFKVGDLAVYFEIDSWIPEAIAPFLCKDKREYNGVAGARLRTVRLRKQISQGLLLPILENAKEWADELLVEGADLTEFLGIQKYEPPVPAQLAGFSRGNFPSFIPKTDQERIQNLGRELAAWSDSSDVWEVSEKLDGSSMTAYLYQGEFGVCSRNLDLKESDDNAFWKAARKYELEAFLRSTGRNLALQGELIGEGIQKNPYALKGHEFRLFDIYDIDRGRYLSSTERVALVAGSEIMSVPLLDICTLNGHTQDSLLALAEAKSILHSVQREGVVFKNLNNPDVGFKAISNAFLLAEK
jgi:RNA ligase (TIGR02306 family)